MSNPITFHLTNDEEVFTAVVHLGTGEVGIGATTLNKDETPVLVFDQLKEGQKVGTSSAENEAKKSRILIKCKTKQAYEVLKNKVLELEDFFNEGDKDD